MFKSGSWKINQESDKYNRYIYLTGIVIDIENKEKELKVFE